MSEKSTDEKIEEQVKIREEAELKKIEAQREAVRLADIIEEKSKENAKAKDNDNDTMWLADVAVFNEMHKTWEDYKKAFGEKHHERIFEMNNALESRHTETMKKIRAETKEAYKNIGKKFKSTKNLKKKIKIDNKYLPMKEILNNIDACIETIVQEEIRDELGLKK